MASKRTRLIAFGAFAAAAAAAPVIAATTVSTTSPQVSQAGPQCLAWFGNKDDGKCLSYSDGQTFNGGTPDFGIYGPDTGFGVNTGPLLPGRTITTPIN